MLLRKNPIGCEGASGEQPVGLTGLEPVTLRLSSACSNQLSYRPVRFRPEDEIWR